MTITKPDAINYCNECELEYAAHRFATCPLCPLRIAWSETDTAVRHAEPWRVFKTEGEGEIQEILNLLTVSGWLSDSFHVTHVEDRDGLRTVYVAVLRRAAYDPEDYSLRRSAREKALDVYLAKRDQLEAEVQSYRAEHVGEAS